MTPKEKAKKLVYKFRKEFDWVERDYSIDLYRDAKQCALIAVDEILELLYFLSDCSQNVVDKRDYYEEVKQEIEKL